MSAYIVRGEWATKPEYIFAMMLERRKLDYSFQVKVFGLPRGVRGDYRLDFLVRIPPREIPVEILGRYWHTGKLGADDALRAAMIAQRYKVAKVIEIWEDECEDTDTAWEAFRKKAGGL